MSGIQLFGYGNPGKIPSKEILGGKGYGLCTMSKSGLPVPMGMVIPTTECLPFLKEPKVIHDLVGEVLINIDLMKEELGYMPLLSVRSGARVSMPGMCDTLLNIGLNDGNLGEWCTRLGTKAALDSYLRLYCTIEDTVLNIRKDSIVMQLLEYSGVDTSKKEYSIPELRALLKAHKEILDKVHGFNIGVFNLKDQLELAIASVFRSWNNDRAIHYRKAHGYSDDWGTAVVIQMMVFGNKNDNSCSGVLFSRDTLTGINRLQGEFLVNAQGEEIVAGTATPLNMSSMKEWCTESYSTLFKIAKKLETKYTEVQDIEFTIEDHKVYVLQHRKARTNAKATVKIMVDMVNEGLISKEEAFSRLSLEQYNELNRVTIDSSYKVAPDIVGTSASTGIAKGLAVFTSERASELRAKGIDTILVRKETTPLDLKGIMDSVGVITSTGGLTAHAAVVARGLNKPCIVGCNQLQTDGNGFWVYEDTMLVEGATVTMDGSSGRVWVSKDVPLSLPTINKYVSEMASWIPHTRVVCNPKEVLEGYYVSLSTLTSRDEVLEFLEELPTGISYYLDTRVRSPDEDDKELEYLFGNAPTLTEAQVLALVLLKRKKLSKSAIIVSSNITKGSRVRLLEAGFTLANKANSLFDLVQARDGIYILSPQLKSSSIMINELQQLIMESGRSVTIINNVKTVDEVMYDQLL